MTRSQFTRCVRAAVCAAPLAFGWGGGVPPAAAHTQIVGGINGGQAVVNWVGHGEDTSWSQQDVFDSSNVPELTKVLVELLALKTPPLVMAALKVPVLVKVKVAGGLPVVVAVGRLVWVGVRVGVPVGVIVAEAVGVGVFVGVLVGTGVRVGPIVGVACSTWQPWSQPSPLTRLPSSQSSNGSSLPSPQRPS